MSSILAMLLVVGVVVAAPAVAQQVPPGETYRTIETERFRITYGPGLSTLAARTGEAAERALDRLSSWFLTAPDGTIDVLLTDHADFSNGAAQVFPSNRILVLAQPPLAGMGLSHFDSWIDLVVTHELTHILQLDHAGTLGTLVRSVFGRPPWTWPTYPGYAAAPFGVEGVAVLAETRHSSAGRLESGFFESIARTQALGGVAETVSQALGDSPYWPGGARPYVFGSLFFDYLAVEYGNDAVADYFVSLADQWIPYRLNAAASSAFGRSFTDLWGDWTDQTLRAARDHSARAEARSRGHTSGDVELLTNGARNGLYAAPGPVGSGRVAYARADGRSDARLVLIEDGTERTLSRWNSLDPPRWSASGDLIVTQLEYLDRYRIIRDLHRVSLDGTVTRITSGLRVVHADPHPADGSIVAVVAEPGTNRLVVLDARGGELREIAASAPQILWSHPRWSPDGTRIAAARRTADGLSAIVVMDSEGRIVASVAEGASQQTAPAWSADGETLMFASDRSGSPNLFAAAVGEAEGPVGPLMQVTDVVTGATLPSIDAAGRWVYFSVLGPEGWDVARIPYDPDAWVGAGPVDPRFGTAPERAEPGEPAQEDGIDRPYSAFSTVLPRYWAPVRVPSEASLGRDVLDTAWGARTSGHDLLTRHAYEASVAASLGDDMRRWEWSGRYAWAGLGNPTLFVDAAQAWETRAPLLAVPDDAPVGAEPDTLLTAVRERWVGGGLELRRQRVRSTLAVAVTGRSVSQDRRLFELDGAETDRFVLTRPRLSAFELGVSVGWSSARSHEFSVSREDGLSASARLRQRWDTAVPDDLTGVAGADGGLRDAVLTLEGYEGIGGPGFADHVLAVRGSIGISDGPGAGSGHFSVGGGRGDTLGFLGTTLGSGPRQFPVRGVAPGALRGGSAWSTVAEWRFPLAGVRAGLGALPLYVDRVAGAVFVDFGGVERDDSEAPSVRETIGSVGVEVTVFHSRFFEGTELLRVGLAVPVRVPSSIGDGPSVYLETGWSF